jgi:tetratricopeptide (TPR) repeat protein
MELHYKMGELLLKQKRFKDAKTYYQKVIEIKPDYFWALRGLGDILKEDGNLKDALLLYHQAIEINPSYFYGYDKIGRILQVQGDFSQAITYFRKALEIKPDATITLKALEECLDQQRKKKIN